MNVTPPDMGALLDAIRGRMSFASVHSLDCDTPEPTATVRLSEIDALRTALTAEAKRAGELESANVGQRHCIAAIVMQCGGKFELNQRFFRDLRPGMFMVEVTDPPGKDVRVIRVVPINQETPNV